MACYHVQVPSDLCHETGELVNAEVRKWLGLPRCLSSIGLYGNGALSLPISSLMEGFPAAAVADAKSALQHWDIEGHVQRGRGGFGLGEKKPTCQKASQAERWLLVVEEVCCQEEASRCATALSARQGCWMR